MILINRNFKIANEGFYSIYLLFHFVPTIILSFSIIIISLSTWFIIKRMYFTFKNLFFEIIFYEKRCRLQRHLHEGFAVSKGGFNDAERLLLPPFDYEP